MSRRLLYLRGWSDEDAALCENAIGLTGTAQDHGTLIRRYGIAGILDCWRSNYPDCRVAGTEGKKLAHEVGDIYVYVLFNILESTALLHLGEWRRLSEETRAAQELAERNANRHASALCHLTFGWLSVEAMDFEGARALCERISDDVVNESPFAYFFQRAVLAEAFVGLQDSEAAAVQFTQIRHRVDTDGMDLDFTIYTQLYHSFGEYCLLAGDLTQARQRATQLQDYAAPAPDRNHLAIAFALHARISLAEGDLPAARNYAVSALDTLGQCQMPLAAWRVQYAVAEVYEKSGDPERARVHAEQCQTQLRNLAAEFHPNERLHHSILKYAAAIAGG